MNSLAQFPPIRWIIRHPRVSAWAFLSIGMVVLLVIEASSVGLLPGQWLALIGACVLVAGICIWIVSWEDSDEESHESPRKDTPTP